MLFRSIIFPDGTIRKGFFENNIYKGPAHKTAIIKELKKPYFDIMSLAPQGITFSGEIFYWNPTIGLTECVHTDFPHTKPKKLNHPIINKISRYLHRNSSMDNSYDPNLTQQLNSKKRFRSHIRKSQRKLAGVNPIHTLVINRDNGRKVVNILRNNENIMKAQVKLKKLSTRKKQKRVWIPSGTIHYNDGSVLKHKKQSATR